MTNIPVWWNTCETCGSTTLGWNWTKPHPKGPVYFQIGDTRRILCKGCAQTAWDVERLDRIVNGD